MLINLINSIVLLFFSYLLTPRSMKTLRMNLSENVLFYVPLRYLRIPLFVVMPFPTCHLLDIILLSIMPDVPIKRLQVCGGMAQPNEKESQQMMVCSKGKALPQRLIPKL